MESVAERHPSMNGERPGAQQFHCNRGPNCWCCGQVKIRQKLPAPTPDDPDYVVRVCPECDLTPAPVIPWPKRRPPTSG